MPPKRSAEGTQSGADKKRQRMRDQRSIPVQGQPRRQGGSTASGNNSLPPTIEVEKFAQARAFEITAMQRAMKSAKEAGTQRAFQSLPRHLRRRAASHNIRRLPLRLRERAKAEVPKDAAKPKKVSRKMLARHRRVRPGLKAEMFRKRQREKLWLGTHVWHAKRMHMTDIWGYRLAEKPTEKAYRSSYRAAFHGAMLHDASYYQYFQLDGPEASLRTLLDKVCDPSSVSPNSKRYSTGAREHTTNVYDPKSQYPCGLIGPASFIWRPLPPPLAGKSSVSTDRTILVRVHPAIAATSFAAFENALDDTNKVKVTKHEEKFDTFEVTGQRAAEVVKAVLRPIEKTSKETKAAWRQLDPQAGPGSVPEGMIFGFKVYDPRLAFPPKLDKSSIDDQGPIVPSSEIAQVEPFWELSMRDQIATPRFKKKDLDARRSQNLVPGTSLRPLAQDDRIPILLSQQTLAPTSRRPPDSALSSRSTARFTLTIPHGWSMAFWSSLVYSSPRVAGLRERALSTYEAGMATFPQDFPSTDAYLEHEKRREADDRGYWDRRPPAKRPNYAKLGTDDPWNLHLEQLLDRCLEPTDSNPINPYLVPFKIATSVAAVVSKEQQQSLNAEKSVESSVERLERDLVESWTILQSGGVVQGSTLSRALVRVRIEPCLRGVPEDFGIIYDLGSEECARVRAKMEKAKKNLEVLATGEGEGAEDLCEVPTKESIVGRITTGTFSLARGQGHGIGVVSFSYFLQLVHRDASARSHRNLVLFRNRDGETYRAATLSIIP